MTSGASRKYRGEVGAGAILGRYQLVMPIAAGGMGKVWAARMRGRAEVRKYVAIKIAHEGLSRNPEFEKLFLDEARIASAIHHPNVCSLLELGEEDGLLYLVLEWVSGGSLRDLVSALPHRRLPARLAARAMAQACAGLHAAHELRGDDGAHLGVIHRDISPHNILVTIGGHLKITDFGIARAHDQLHQATETGELKGKLSYMAPEQLSSKTYDRRVDVFALGCVLYEITVGAKAFDGEGVAALYKVLESKFEPPSRVVSDYPSELEAIVLRALARAPDERFASAEDMGVALERYIAASGAPCTEADLARLVESALGDGIQNRMIAIRNAALELEDGATTSAPGRGLHSSHLLTTALDVSGEQLRIAGSTATPAITPMADGSKAPRVMRQASLGVAIVAGVLVGAVAGSRSSWMRASSASPMAVSRPPLSDASASAARVSAGAAASVASPVPSVEIRLIGAPAGAEVLLDGRPVADPLRLVALRDGQSHALRVRADGYEDATQVVVFDTPRTIEVHLAPHSSRRVGAHPTLGRAPRSPATAQSPAPPGEKAARPAPPRSEKSLDLSDPFDE